MHVANGVRLIHLNSWVVFISLGLRSWVAKKMAAVHVLLRVDLLVSRNSCDHSEMVFMKPMLSGSVLSAGLLSQPHSGFDNLLGLQNDCP